jgi:hypothetical protein
MPMPFVDHTGKTFGFWTVKSFYGRDKSNHQLWLCVCKCGNEKPVIMGSLRKGASASCGCNAINKRSSKLTKHGMAGTPTYKSWHQMHQRCSGKHGHDYYLKSGITVCERWNDFLLFYEDMGERPDGTTLDRIDGSRGYEPSNCRWATTEEQANNKKTNVKQTVFGEVLTPALASRKYGMHISCIRHRMRKGMTLEQAVSTPLRRQK